MKVQQIFTLQIALLVFILVGTTSSIAHALEPASCNFPVNQFENYTPGNFFEPWDIDDNAGNSIEWSNLSACGAANTNYTGGTDNAMCVDAQIGGPAFDTTLESNEFTLVGATNAAFAYRINYDDVGAGGDKVDVDVSDNGGSTWTTLFTYDFDAGVPFVEGGQVGVLSLLPYIGQDDMKIRFRYYDPTGGADSGSYVQIDTFIIACLGGADMQASITSDKNTVIEGEEVNYTYSFFNAGPMTANNILAIGNIPPGFALLESNLSSGLLVQNGPSGTAGQVASIVTDAQVKLTIKARAITVSEVNLDVLSPAIITGNYDAKGATFGARIDAENPLNGMVILADDATMDANDGCEALVNTDQTAGNIVFLENKSNCSFDEQIKNAQDAGAIGAIVEAEQPPFPLPDTLGPLAPLLGTFSGFDTLAPSGNVTEPITIPSILVEPTTGTAIQTNIVNSVNVRINGVDFNSQERHSSGATFAEEFDPDFNSSSIFTLLFSNQDTDNFAFKAISVLRDTDSDGTPDQDDPCKRDPNKTTPDICGCDIADQDINANGITDCLSTEELKAKLDQADQLVKKLKRNKGQKAIKKELKALLTEIVNFANAEAQDILLINSGANLNKLVKKARRKGRKATKNKLASFAKNKKLARKAIKRAAKVLA